MSEDRRVRRARIPLYLAGTIGTLLAVLFCTQPARASDGYDSSFAKAVRSATDQYRLVVWARNDGYIQSTDYVPGLGSMYTNHDRFSPASLAQPTMLVYDLAGRLLACGYQFVSGSAVPAAFDAIPASAWYDIPRHVHYNITVGAKTYYAQADWPGNEPATADTLIAKKLMPSDATLLFAFVHPRTRAVLVWAWLPNSDGLFAGTNALLP